ncbi:hypothetical protein [Pantoea sp. B65]
MAGIEASPQARQKMIAEMPDAMNARPQEQFFNAVVKGCNPLPPLTTATK